MNLDIDAIQQRHQATTIGGIEYCKQRDQTGMPSGCGQIWPCETTRLINEIKHLWDLLPILQDLMNIQSTIVDAVDESSRVYQDLQELLGDLS